MSLGTSTAGYPASPQRKSFYINGRFWVFYSDGTNIVYQTSIDGITWTAETNIRSCTSGRYFSVYCNGTYFGYTFCDTTLAAIYFRRGTPNPDGSISWSTNENTVIENLASLMATPELVFDSNGYPWIGYSDDEGVATRKYPFVVKATAEDGSTWDTPVKLSTNDMNYHVIPVALTAGKVYVLYAQSTTFVDADSKGKLWDGFAWGGEETVGQYKVLSLEFDWYANSYNDTVYITYLSISPYQVRFNVRVYGVGWNATDELLQDDAEFDSVPNLTVDETNGNMYCIYPNAPIVNSLFYRKYIASTSTWDSVVEWLNYEISQDTLTSFAKARNYLGILYLQPGSGQLYFNYLETNTPSIMESVLPSELTIQNGVLS